MPCAGQALDKDTILAHPCDVLIPAAIGGVLDETTAKDVQVSLVGCSASFLAGASNSLTPFETAQVCSLARATGACLLSQEADQFPMRPNPS